MLEVLTMSGWPHPWNPWISDMSLKSLKSPWIIKMILQFWVHCDLKPHIFSKIGAAMRPTSISTLLLYNFFSHVITFFQCGFLFGRHIVIPDHWIAVFPSYFDILENYGKILEISLNYSWILSWEFCGHPVCAMVVIPYMVVVITSWLSEVWNLTEITMGVPSLQTKKASCGGG